MEKIERSELYDLKYTISGYVLPRLKAFKEKYENRSAPSVPTFEEEELRLGRELSFKQAEAYWAGILGEMIFPFEYHVDPEKYEHLEYDEIRASMKNGLELFAKYFENLWI